MANDEAEGLCPRVQAAFELLGRKWTGLIVHELLSGDRCFSELARSVPSLSARMLALRMRELEAAGILVRSVSPGPPLRVSYSLTEKGRALKPVLGGLAAWARKWS
jgi:DNA-binding HxlR family transcriptional regulator